MNQAAFFGALLRAAPLCAVLPLPGLAARIALGLILAAAAMGAPGVDAVGISSLGSELGRGLALGLGIAIPLYAARWAGGLMGVAIGKRGARGPELIASVMGWVIFCAAGGATLLVGAFLHSYTRWPVAAKPVLDSGVIETVATFGGELVALTARLALPTLLVVALVELAAGLLVRFERGGGVEPGAEAIARTARPILVAVLLAASVAAFTHGVGAVVLARVRGM